VDILFGGQNGSQFLNDTWEFTADQWIQLPTPHAPSPRAGASLAFDYNDSSLVLFGGWNGVTYLDDTWNFSGNWTNITANVTSHGSPSARGYAAMTYNGTSARGVLVLFGGRDDAGALADSWELGKVAWKNETAKWGAPPARSDSGIVYDAVDGYTLLFGGLGTSGYLGDTWKLFNGQWSQVPVTASPPARADFSLVYDPATNYTVLFGGWTNQSGTVNLFSDTWTYVSGDWTRVTTVNAPAPRWQMEAAWDSQNQSVVVGYGSLSGDPLTSTDVWFFADDSWTFVSTVQLADPEPSERTFAAVANDSTDFTTFEQKVFVYTSVLLFGGNTSVGMNNQTWLYDNQFWTEIFPAISPSPRDAAALIDDEADGYMVLFGGQGPNGQALGDTWTYHDGVWTNITATAGPAPAPRFGAGIMFDIDDNEVILFGGTDGSTFFNDTWSFSHGQWLEITSNPSPGVRAFPGFVFDGNQSYGLLFGGRTESTVLDDTWSLVGTQWTQLTLKASPPPSWDVGLVYNENDTQTPMFGGCGATSPASLMGCTDAENLTWKFGGTTWRLIAPVGNVPPARFAQAATYDGTDTNVLLWGGSNGTTTLVDRWGLDGSRWTLWTPQIAPTAREGTSTSYSKTLNNQFYFGGYGITPSGTLGYLNQTWLYHTGEWREVPPQQAPPARAYAAQGTTDVGFNTSSHRPNQDVIVFGGFGPTGYLGDTWEWQGGSETGGWTNVTPAVGPSPRANASMATVYSSVPNVASELVLFGGQNSTTNDLGDTWVWEAGAWSQVVTPVHPPARASASMVYDAIDHYVVLFGGVNLTTGHPYNDTWAFTGSIWVELAETGAPSPRYGAAATWASVTTTSGTTGYFGYVELFGGESSPGHYLGDTWEFHDGAWTQLDVGVRPEPIPAAYVAMSCNFNDGYPVLVGGMDGAVESAVWVYR
jgi:hypothetical protein